MSNLKTILVTATSFVSTIGLRPIWSTKNTEGQPATLGKEAEEIINGNFSVLEAEASKKADETNASGKVVRTPDGKIPIVDLSGKVDKKVIYNVTQITGVTYTDKTTARNAIPSNLRGLGQFVIYKLSTVWINEKFIGTDVSGWTTESNWKDIGGVTLEDLAKKADIVDAEGRYIVRSEAQQPIAISLTNVNKGLSTDPSILGSLVTATNSNVSDLINISKLGSKIYFSGTLPITNNTTTVLGCFYGPRETGISLFYRPQSATVKTYTDLEIQVPKGAVSIRFVSVPTYTDLSFKGFPFTAFLTDAFLHTSNISDKIKHIGYASKPNILVSQSFVKGTVYNNDGVLVSGIPVQSYGYETTFIPVVPGATYDTNIVNLSTALPGIMFYTENKTWADLGGVTAVSLLKTNDATHLLPRHFVVPDNVHWIRYQLTSNPAPSLGWQIVQRFAEAPPLSVVMSLEDIQGAESISSNPELFRQNNLIVGKTIFLDGTIATYAALSYNDELIPVKADTLYNTTIPTIGNNQTLHFYNSAGTWLTCRDPLDGKFFTPPNTIAMKYNILTTNKGVMYSIKKAGQGVTFPDLYVSEDNIISSGNSGMLISARNDTTFVGSFNTILYALYTAKPKSRVAIISHFTSDGTLNGADGYMQALINTQEALANYRSIYFMNLAKKMYYMNRDGINTLQAWIPDGVHPGSDSSQVAANDLTAQVTEFLRPIFGANWTNKKVGLYGTSISAGYLGTGTLHAGWAKFIERAVVALGGTVYNYASTGSVMRRRNTGGTLLSNSFMDSNNSWAYQNSIIAKIGTAQEPDLHIFEYGYNDFYWDASDFKKKW